MLKNLLEFNKLLRKGAIEIANSKISKIIKEYSFYNITEKCNIDLNFAQDLKDSKVIIIDQFSDNSPDVSGDYFILSFKKTLVFVDQQSISLIKRLLSINPDVSLCFLSSTENIFKQRIQIENQIVGSDSFFMDSISNFSEQIRIRQTSGQRILPMTWKIIRTSIIGFLIKQAFAKNGDQNNFEENKIFDLNDFIEIKNIGCGSSFTASLVYHIDSGYLFVIKRPVINDEEHQEYMKREIEILSRIKHPNIVKFYGFVKDKNYPVIGFINGSTLLNSKWKNLDDLAKINVLLKTLRALSYIHDNKIIYRDLKPNNILLDEKNSPIIIDFDKAIQSSDKENDTCYFSSPFCAPEVNNQIQSYASDVYSFGKLVNYMFDKEGTKEYDELKLLYKECIEDEIDKRPSIYEISKGIYRVFESEKISVISSKFSKNGFLSDFLRKKTNIDNTSKAIILIGIARGMQYLNEKRNINRDLGPANILLDDKCLPLVSDFGLSKKYIKDKVEIQLKNDLVPVNSASDVFSFGTIMYEIVTGKKYTKDTPTQLNSFDKPIIHGDGISESMKNLIKQCWSENVSDRPTFNEIYEELVFINDKDDYILDNVDQKEVKKYLEQITNCENDFYNDFQFYDESPNYHEDYIEETRTIKVDSQIRNNIKYQKYEDQTRKKIIPNNGDPVRYTDWTMVKQYEKPIEIIEIQKRTVNLGFKFSPDKMIKYSVSVDQERKNILDFHTNKIIQEGNWYGVKENLVQCATKKIVPEYRKYIKVTEIMEPSPDPIFNCIFMKIKAIQRNVFYEKRLKIIDFDGQITYTEWKPDNSKKTESESDTGSGHYGSDDCHIIYYQQCVNANDSMVDFPNELPPNKSSSDSWLLVNRKRTASKFKMSLNKSKTKPKFKKTKK